MEARIQACVFGYIVALYVLCWAVSATGGAPWEMVEYLRSANGLLRMNDFDWLDETTTWPISSWDILGNMERFRWRAARQSADTPFAFSEEERGTFFLNYASLRPPGRAEGVVASTPKLV